MDFSKLQPLDVLEFIEKHADIRAILESKTSAQKSMTHSPESLRVIQAQQIWETLMASKDFDSAADLTYPVLDLYLGTQVKAAYSNIPSYLLSKLLSADNSFLAQIGSIFGLTLPDQTSPKVDQESWENLRERIIRIIGFADLLINDTFSTRPEDHANEWSVDIPSDFDVETGAMMDTDIITVQDFFPELVAAAKEMGRDFWDIYDPDVVTSWDIRPVIIQKIRDQEKAEQKELRPGDIILGGGSYRNQGRYIFDGQTIVALDDSMDDYGNLPPSFKFPDYPLNYWYNVSGEYLIDHNQIQWIDLERFREELIRNRRGPIGENSSTYRTYIIYQGKKYNFEVRLDQDGQYDFQRGAVTYLPSGYFCFGCN